MADALRRASAGRIMPLFPTLVMRAKIAAHALRVYRLLQKSLRI